MVRYLSCSLAALLVALSILAPYAAFPHGAAADTPPANVDDMKARLETAQDELNTIWEPWFARYKAQQPDAEFVLLMPGDAPYSSSCKDDERARLVATAEDTNAYYCYIDGTAEAGAVTLPVEPLLRFLSGDVWGHPVLPAGNAATYSSQELDDLALFALTMAAHEWGHEVQEELLRTTGRPLAVPPDEELLSDCIAGDYIRRIDTFIGTGANSRDRMLLRAFDAIGDTPTEQSHADLDEPIDEFHGTADERREAFLVGYDSLKDDSLDQQLPTSACFARYWSELGVPA